MEDVFVWESDFAIVRIHPGPATPEERRRHWEESAKHFYRAIEREKKNAELRRTV